MNSPEPQIPDIRDLLQMLVITEMRNYDVLMAILSLQKGGLELSKKLEAHHAKLDNVGPVPWIEDVPGE